MENKNTFGKIRRVIDAVIEKYQADTENGYVALSLTTTIYNALHERKWLPEDTEEVEDILETKWAGANTLVVDHGSVVVLGEDGKPVKNR
jgi:hypothetical protein